jgi:uncharacterized protein YggT (Ycf19 family)
VNVISHFIVVIYLVICITVYCLSHFMHLVVVCKNVGGAFAKCVQRHLRPLRLKMHTFRGELFSILLDTHISFYLTKLCCHQSPKRGRLKVHLGP